MADQDSHQDADGADGIDRRGSLMCMAWAGTGKGAIDKRWQSFDYQGVHFIGLVNEASTLRLLANAAYSTDTAQHSSLMAPESVKRFLPQ